MICTCAGALQLQRQGAAPSEQRRAQPGIRRLLRGAGRRGHHPRLPRAGRLCRAQRQPPRPPAARKLRRYGPLNLGLKDIPLTQVPSCPGCAYVLLKICSLQILPVKSCRCGPSTVPGMRCASTRVARCVTLEYKSRRAFCYTAWPEAFLDFARFLLSWQFPASFYQGSVPLSCIPSC